MSVHIDIISLIVKTYKTFNFVPKSHFFQWICVKASDWCRVEVPRLWIKVKAQWEPISSRVSSFIFALAFHPCNTKAPWLWVWGGGGCRIEVAARGWGYTHKPWQKSISIFARLEGACQADNRFAMCLNNKLLEIVNAKVIVSQTHEHTQYA